MTKQKILISAVFIAAILISRQLLAAPTYGTDVPEKKKISIGYQSNIIFRQDLDKPYGNIRSCQNFLDISYGVASWFSLDGKIGLGDAVQRGGIYPKVEYLCGFAGGYGFRILPLNDMRNKTRIAIGFHHISVHPLAENMDSDRYDAILDDWQCSIVASKDIGMFRPFLGAKISSSYLICKVNDIDKKWRPSRWWGGIVVGCTALLRNDLSIRIESHFIDENSLNAGAYYTF